MIVRLMAKKLAAFRLPHELLGRVKLAAKASGMSQAQFLEKAVEAQLKRVIKLSNRERLKILESFPERKGKAKNN